MLTGIMKCGQQKHIEVGAIEQNIEMEKVTADLCFKTFSLSQEG
jgi:hypothetical protein